MKANTPYSATGSLTMRNIIIPALLIATLTSCTTLWTHEPKLASTPDDQAQYKADLKECRDYVWDANQPSLGQALVGGLGPLGVAAYTASNNDTRPKGSSFDQVDTCMAKKGYQILPKAN